MENESAHSLVKINFKKNGEKRTYREMLSRLAQSVGGREKEAVRDQGTREVRGSRRAVSSSLSRNKH